MSQMISSGRAAAISLTKSHSPSPATRSMMAAAFCWTWSSMRPTWRGVNERLTMRRRRVWRGASMLIIEPKNSAISIGRSGMLVPRPDTNCWGLRLASITSAYRVSDQ